MATLVLGACSAPSGPLAGPGPITNPTASAGWSAGQGSAPVFATPGVRGVLGPNDLAALPEYSRQDLALSASTPGPILATDEWPQPQAPSMMDSRYFYLPSNPQTMWYIDPDASSYGRYGRYGWYGRYGRRY